MTPRFPMTILTAAILSLPALALAGHGRHDSPACAAKHAEKLANYDSNADGELDREERMAIRRDKHEDMLTRYDANRDGELDRNERLVMQRERMNEMFQKHDSNRDSLLSAAEVEASCSRLTRHFEAIDSDRNGQITRAEIQAHHESRAAHRRGKHGKHGGWRHHDKAQ